MPAKKSKSGKPKLSRSGGRKSVVTRKPVKPDKKKKAANKTPEKNQFDSKSNNVLVESLTQAIRELLVNTDISSAIATGLRLLGQATNVDRVYLFENDPQTPGKPLATSQRYEWNSGTAEPQIDNPELQNLPYAQIEPCYGPLSANKPYVQIVREMEEGSFKRILQDEDIQSVLLFPIFQQSKFWGFIGFDECKYERKWTDIEISVLSGYSAAIAAALERIHGEKNLKESEQRFRTLQEASFGGIGLHDRGKILDCNQGLCTLTGYSTAELIGKNGLELIAPEWRDFVMEKILSGYDKPYDVEGIRKDGTRYFLEIKGKNIPSVDRTIRVTEFRDITDRKHAEEKIIEQNTKLLSATEELKRKNNQLEEFTHIVSHNLRSPVGNILSLLSFYEGAHSEQEKREYIDLLKEAAMTTLMMLDELNDILKVKQAENIEKHQLKFESMFHQVKSMLNARITQLSARVTGNFIDAPEIHYPPIYLESIMLNLLDNALKYHSPERTPNIEFISYTDNNGHTILEARDNGLGINLQRYQQHLFKLRKTFHRHPESRGVGLFMIKNQIDAMGGEISIASEENKGTTFFVNFNKHLSNG